jgi:hypothetical protein
MNMQTFKFLLWATPVVLSGQALTPAWVVLSEGSQAQVRIVVANPQDCPRMQVDGIEQAMTLRQPMPEGLRPACEFTLPANAKHASVHGQILHLPRKNPLSVIALGDTGCRIKGPRVQSCNDPLFWPFAQVAATAATQNPDLVIHVGDYLYREDMCPVDAQDKCGGTPSGDNWETWNADFFKPAAKLLAAAPWAFSRGNHEDCNRAWRGWFYYLDPRPMPPGAVSKVVSKRDTCEDYSAPYVIKLGKFELAMFDSAPVKEDVAEEKQVAEFTTQLRDVAARLTTQHAWLADHHPFWGFKSEGKSDEPRPVSAPLQAAWDRAAPKGIDLVLSGHIHLFELLSFDAGSGKNQRPVQIVAGDGGTDLAAPIKASLNGIDVHGTKVGAVESQRQFGYTVLSRASKADRVWKIALKNRGGQTLLLGTFKNGQASMKDGQTSVPAASSRLD